jgi:NUP50 (Nucleoporin 50 kDa)
MSSKRVATSDLNHDNWNEEEEPEAPGVFKKASDTELQRRVIISAKRRIATGSGKSVCFFLSAFINISANFHQQTFETFPICRMNRMLQKLRVFSAGLPASERLRLLARQPPRHRSHF